MRRWGIGREEAREGGREGGREEGGGRKRGMEAGRGEGGEGGREGDCVCVCDIPGKCLVIATLAKRSNILDCYRGCSKELVGGRRRCPKTVCLYLCIVQRKHFLQYP